jgi:hemoglobin
MSLRFAFLSLALAAPLQAATLYERLGGKATVSALSDDLVTRAAADKRIKGRFLEVDLPRLKSGLADFFCTVTGGPCPSVPQELRRSHSGMQLVNVELDAFFEDLVESMKKANLPAPEQQELTAALRRLAPDVVHPPPPDAGKADQDLVDKAKQLSSMLNNVGKLKAGELLELAVAARLRGQRSYAEYLYSCAELLMKPEALAIIAPLFREGGPPRVTMKPKPADNPPQPPAAGSSDDDDPAARPKAGKLQGSFTVDGKPQLAVVLLNGPKRRPHARVLEVRNGQLAPQLLVAPLGSTVSFANFDNVFHDLFSLSPTRPFDLGLYKGGEAREVTFEKEGVVRVGCSLHPHTAAYVIVTGAGWYSVSDGSGHFSFKSLPPGKYKLRAWSPSSAEWTTRQVEVRAGDNTLELDGKGGPAPELVDKFGAAPR